MDSLSAQFKSLVDKCEAGRNEIDSTQRASERLLSLLSASLGQSEALIDESPDPANAASGVVATGAALVTEACDKLRHSARSLRLRMENYVDRLNEALRLTENELSRWSSYSDCRTRLLGWLDKAEHDWFDGYEEARDEDQAEMVATASEKRALAAQYKVGPVSCIKNTLNSCGHPISVKVMREW
ncbi:unnamed protein product [Protopolystoma xenopodis]|uniref:Uncharacterized protein n=1 Tax=Protopolystoma xenopodis TaxID=117903 RepID=A0A3S5AD97_9PLAT|nr:unnamed protein product [Protopolystoma xenopodis]